MNLFLLSFCSFFLGIIISYIVYLFIFKNKYRELSTKFQQLSTDFQLVQARYEDLQIKLTQSEQITNDLKIQNQKQREENIKIITEATILQEQTKKRQEELDKISQQTKLEFENLSNKIFDKKIETFSKLSKHSLTDMLEPIKEKFTDFQKTINDQYGLQMKETFSLKEEIKKMSQVSGDMVYQTENLSKALKGDVKMQGTWGEVTLEKILELSGLIKDTDYVMQGKGLGLRDEDGGVQLPDVVVHLPENKHIIIDAKISLTSYARLVEFPDNKDYLKQLVVSIKNHINGLEKKKYHMNDKLGSPEFTLMFMPIDGMYLKALEHEPYLNQYAWGKGIVTVIPSTLTATLKIVATMWRMEKQNKNALEIAKVGGTLYDKMTLFAGDLQKIGTQIEQTQKTYDTALGKFSEGRGNMVKQAFKLKELGAKASKEMPLGDKKLT